jgi:hypothetical protein
MRSWRAAVGNGTLEEVADGRSRRADCGGEEVQDVTVEIAVEVVLALVLALTVLGGRG